MVTESKNAASLRPPIPLRRIFPRAPSPYKRRLRKVLFPDIIAQRPLLRPIPGNIDICSRHPHLEEDKQQIIDHDTKTKQLPGPDTASVIPFQSIYESEALHTCSSSGGGPSATGMVAVEFLFAEGAGDAIVDSLCPLGHVCP